MGDRFAGAGNYLIGAAPSYTQGVNTEVARSTAARERSPYASITGDVLGSLAIPGFGGAKLAGYLGSKLGGRVLGYGAEGAGIGAAQGAGNTYTGNISDYLTNAGWGGGLGSILGGAFGGAFGARPAKSTAVTPALPEISRGTDIAYDALRANPTPYDASLFRQAGTDLKQNLFSQGYVPEYSPGSFAAVKRMDATASIPDAVVTPTNIDLIRKGINRIPRTEEAATDRSSGQVVKKALDDFLANPPPGAVRPGFEADAAVAAQQANVAHGMAAGEFRAQKMADIMQAADNATAAANSGLNKENIIRQSIKNFVNPLTGGKQRLAGYPPEAQQALQDVIHRGALANVGRYAGNILSGGGGAGAGIAGAAYGLLGGVGGQYLKDSPLTYGAAGFGVPLVGLGLRSLSNRSAANTIRAADEIIRQGNPLYQARAGVAPMAVPNPRSDAAQEAARNALTAALVSRQAGSDSNAP
jgi:hypothetical protein